MICWRLRGRLWNFPLVSPGKHKTSPLMPTSSMDCKTLETDSSELSGGWLADCRSSRPILKSLWNGFFTQGRDKSILWPINIKISKQVSETESQGGNWGFKDYRDNVNETFSVGSSYGAFGCQSVISDRGGSDLLLWRNRWGKREMGHYDILLQWLRMICIVIRQDDCLLFA